MTSINKKEKILKSFGNTIEELNGIFTKRHMEPRDNVTVVINKSRMVHVS